MSLNFQYLEICTTYIIAYQQIEMGNPKALGTLHPFVKLLNTNAL